MARVWGKSSTEQALAVREKFRTSRLLKRRISPHDQPLARSKGLVARAPRPSGGADPAGEALAAFDRSQDRRRKSALCCECAPPRRQEPSPHPAIPENPLRPPSRRPQHQTRPARDPVSLLAESASRPASIGERQNITSQLAQRPEHRPATRPTRTCAASRPRASASRSRDR